MLRASRYQDRRDHRDQRRARDQGSWAIVASTIAAEATATAWIVARINTCVNHARRGPSAGDLFDATPPRRARRPPGHCRSPGCAAADRGRDEEGERRRQRAGAIPGVDRQQRDPDGEREPRPCRALEPQVVGEIHPEPGERDRHLSTTPTGSTARSRPRSRRPPRPPPAAEAPARSGSASRLAGGVGRRVANVVDSPRSRLAAQSSRRPAGPRPARRRPRSRPGRSLRARRGATGRGGRGGSVRRRGRPRVAAGRTAPGRIRRRRFVEIPDEVVDEARPTVGDLRAMPGTSANSVIAGTISRPPRSRSTTAGGLPPEANTCSNSARGGRGPEVLDHPDHAAADRHVPHQLGRPGVDLLVALVSRRVRYSWGRLTGQCPPRCLLLGLGPSMPEGVVSRTVRPVRPRVPTSSIRRPAAARASR